MNKQTIGNSQLDVSERNKQLANDNCPIGNKKRVEINDVEAENLAKYLADKYNNCQNYKWYLWIVYRIPTQKIYQLVDRAQGGKNPAKLFTYLARRQLRESL